MEKLVTKNKKNIKNSKTVCDDETDATIVNDASVLSDGAGIGGGGGGVEKSGKGVSELLQEAVSKDRTGEEAVDKV